MTPHVEDEMLEFFKANISDIKKTVKEAFDERSMWPLQYHKVKIEKMREFARVHLTHFGIARAMAYALTSYAEKITWTPRKESGFYRVTSRDITNPSLPRELMDIIRSKD